MGMPCDLARILADRAAATACRVIEDAACAIGSEILWDGQWEKIGRPHGDIACFSFHPRKVISTGDGGMITTATCRVGPAVPHCCASTRMSVPDTVRHGASQVIFESYPIVGYNYRMTDIQAAVGREQLKRLPGIVAERRAAGRCATATLLGRSPDSACRMSRSGRARTGRASPCACRGMSISAA